MGRIPNFGAPRQYSLTVSGKAADAKAVGDKINTINEILSPLKTTKITSGDWTCITLACGIKMCFSKGNMEILL